MINNDVMAGRTHWCSGWDWNSCDQVFVSLTAILCVVREPEGKGSTAEQRASAARGEPAARRLIITDCKVPMYLITRSTITEDV
ncbi:hypothetical protein ACHAWX_003688 [Stephanocyclus meneghinianus]